MVYFWLFLTFLPNIIYRRKYPIRAGKCFRASGNEVSENDLRMLKRIQIKSKRRSFSPCYTQP